MTEKRFKLRLSKLRNGMITDTQKREDLYFDKEFLDLLLLSKAKVIYRIHKGKMYYSGFPLTAGMIGNVEVKTIEIK